MSWPTLNRELSSRPTASMRSQKNFPQALELGKDQ